MNYPNRIILHCTATPTHVKAGFYEIEKWHKDRGFKVTFPIDGKDMTVYCGYHTIFRRSGKIETGRPDYIQGAHAYGNNENTLGWVYEGLDKMTPMQVTSIMKQFALTYKVYKIKPNSVIGHYETGARKTCPNQDMEVFRRLLWTTI